MRASGGLPVRKVDAFRRLSSRRSPSEPAARRGCRRPRVEGRYRPRSRRPRARRRCRSPSPNGGRSAGQRSEDRRNGDRRSVGHQSGRQRPTRLWAASAAVPIATVAARANAILRNMGYLLAMCGWGSSHPASWSAMLVMRFMVCGVTNHIKLLKTLHYIAVMCGGSAARNRAPSAHGATPRDNAHPRASLTRVA
jgi:hypothetical protein